MAHAEADAAAARELAAFLTAGCDVSIFGHDGLIGPGQDLLDAAENGLAADILVLLLSPASSPAPWVRERWQSVLVERAAEFGTRVAIMLLEHCPFPALLTRGAGFCDATAGKLAAWRRLKRWLWGIELGTEPAMAHSADLEALYVQVADRVGVAKASPERARRFAQEAAREFQAVLWIPAHRRTLPQVVCETGTQLGMRLPGPVEEDCRAVRSVLCHTRCLIVLDAPTADVNAMLPDGRSSVLFTTEPETLLPGQPPDTPSVALARRLLTAGRVSEAYEMLRKLFDAGVETEPCARELVWICEQWDRMEEANRLRFLATPCPSEQLRLF